MDTSPAPSSAPSPVQSSIRPSAREPPKQSSRLDVSDHAHGRMVGSDGERVYAEELVMKQKGASQKREFSLSTTPLRRGADLQSDDTGARIPYTLGHRT